MNINKLNLANNQLTGALLCCCAGSGGSRCLGASWLSRRLMNLCLHAPTTTGTLPAFVGRFPYITELVLSSNK